MFPPAVPECVAPHSAAELTSTLAVLKLFVGSHPWRITFLFRDRLRILANAVVVQQARLAAQLLSTEW